jgi:repressor LexA
MTELGILEYDSTRRIATREDLKRSRINDRIPLVGQIACGSPMLAEENIEEYISLSESLIGKGDFFALRAEGQSMINAGINNGDIVLIRQQNDAQPGQIIVALVDEETATLKRYRPNPRLHCVELEPANPEYKAQIIDLKHRSFSIQGIAVMIIRHLEN